MEERGRNFFVRTKEFFSGIFEKLVKIDDSPQRIALGFGLGVFLGILPGTGPVASLGLAFLLRVNRVAALAGSVLTNTWLSVVTFVFSIKIGSAILGLEWSQVYAECRVLFQNFHWRDLFKAPILKIIYPLGLGYLVVGLTCGFVAYIIAIYFLTQRAKYLTR